MSPSSSSPDGLLVTIVLATLAIGLPIVFVLSIRFLLDRNLNLGRSKEIEKLIWQLHRIASSMEQQLKPPTTTQNVAASAAAAAPATPVTHPARVEQPETQPAATQPASVSQTAAAEPSAQGERHGVNSMFGF
jgi:uncharacterized membrane protein